MSPDSHWLLKYRVPILTVVFGATIFWGWQASQLRIDFSPQQMFETSEVDEVWTDWQETIEAFGVDDDQLLVVLDAQDGGDILAEANRAWLREATRALSELEGVDAVTSLANVVSVRETETGDLHVGTVDSLPSAELLEDTLLAGTLVSEDNQLTLIAVDIDDAWRAVEDLTRVLEGVRAFLGEHPPPAPLSVSLAGIPFVRADVVAGLERDQMTFVPMAGMIMALALLISFRRVSRVIIPLLTVSIATIWGVGFMALMDVPLDIINNVLPALVMVIGISDGLHLMVRDQEEHALGHPRHRSLSTAVRLLATACFLTSFTTAVGFASLTISGTSILQRFGLVLAFAILMAYVLTMGVLPQLLSFAAEPRTVPQRSNLFGGIAVRLGRPGIERPVLVSLLGVLVAGGLLGLGYHLVYVDTYLTEVYPQDHPSRVAQNLVDAHLGGVLPLSIVVEVPDEDAHTDPEILRRIAELQRRFSAYDGVTSVRSAVDFLSVLHRTLAGEDAGPLPTTQAAAAQEWLMAELGDSPLELAEYVADSGKRLRIIARTADVGGRRVLELARHLDADAHAIFSDMPEVRVRLTGDAYVASRNMHQLIRDLFLSLALAGAVIFLTLLVIFRSVRLALVSIIPNALPLIATLALMGLVGMTLDVTNVVIFSISLGMAVDDTIHVIARFREERLAGGSIDEILERSLRGTGQAVVLTSVLIGSGMLILVFSEFVPTRRFGYLTGFTLLIALIADLVLLPAFLKLAFRRDHPAGAPPSLAGDAPDAG